MDDLKSKTLEELIRPEGFSCSCGRVHKSAIPCIHIGSGALESVSEALTVIGKNHPMVLCGPNGYEAAGKAVCRLLEESGIPYTLHVLEEEDGGMLRPAEYAVGSAVLNFDHDADVVLGVGSGVINDTCKVIGKVAKLPCMIVGSAPSMDGFASDGSSMEVGGIKQSLKEQIPEAIICDTDILAQAPMHMIHAGIGDILAKTSSLFDWKLSAIATGEHYCEEIAALVRQSLENVIRLSPQAVQRDGDAVKEITDGLVLSGVAMALEGSSHPASGLEHYFSHCWEMMKLERGEPYELHGIQVGIGMLLVLKIAEWLKTVRPDRNRVEKAILAFDREAWENNIRRVFPKSSAGILEIEESARKNDPDGRRARAGRVIAAWDEILALMEKELPAYQAMAEYMKGLGMPTKPEEIGLSRQDVLDAFVCSRDIRNKYILSSMIWDIGYMEECAAWLDSQLDALI